MYMCKAFSDVLQGTMPSVIHVTCNAHFLLMAVDLLCTHFLHSSFKKIFKHCLSCKLRFKESMANQSGSQAVMLPPEVITRWNSWFNAVAYHRAKNIKYYQQHFGCEALEITSGTQSLPKVSEQHWRPGEVRGWECSPVHAASNMVWKSAGFDSQSIQQTNRSDPRYGIAATFRLANRK